MFRILPRTLSLCGKIMKFFSHVLQILTSKVHVRRKTILMDKMNQLDISREKYHICYCINNV